MNELTDDQRLDEAIRRSGNNTISNDIELDIMLDELGKSILGDSVSSKPSWRLLKGQRRTRRAIAIGATAAVIAVASPAAAFWVGAHTGIFGSPGQTENDTSEWLRADSPEIDAIVDQKSVNYPLPSGGNWDATKKAVHGDGQASLIQESGVEMIVAMHSACQWQRDWLLASPTDADKKRRAVEVLSQVPKWETIRDHDGGGVVDTYEAVAKAASVGNRSGVLSYYATNCAESYGTIEK